MYFDENLGTKTLSLFPSHTWSQLQDQPLEACFFGILAEGCRGVPECQAQSAPDGMAARQETL